MIYLDNAATSWPKPPDVFRAMTEVLEKAGGNPGRSGHALSIEAARVVYDTREMVAGFFGAANPQRVVFTSNVTHSLNIIIRGMLKPGDRVVTTGMEHNAVMRPLRYLEEHAGLTVDVVHCDAGGRLDMNALATALRQPARLVIVNHASNIVGTLQPLEEIAPLARRAGALLVVDAAQTAGVFPIDMVAAGIDILCFTGHKGLLGPTGIGGFILGDAVDAGDIEPLILGGTGSQSEMEIQPDYLPDKYESGTQNIAGIAGLRAGIRWIRERGIETIRHHEITLAERLIDTLPAIRGVTVLGTRDTSLSTAIVSITIEKRSVSEIGLALDETYGILSRVGLHCAPAAHRTIGSFPDGTVRLAPGIFTSAGDIERTILAIRDVATS